MQIRELTIPGAYRITPDPHRDERGFFARTYDADFFGARDLHRSWVQESHSYTARRGTVRGLHVQLPPHSETKLMRVVSGTVYKVLLDLRKGSPQFGRWEAVVLAAEEMTMLFTPPGIALGMCTMTDHCSILYKMDTRYEPASQRAIRWDDPDLAISWPDADAGTLSARDRGAMSFRDFRQRIGPLRVQDG